MYYIEISELPVLFSRTQKDFDDVIFEYITKFKTITTNKEVIVNLIATAIDYPLAYIKELLNSYVRSGLLTSDFSIIKNKEAFVREKQYIKSYKTLYLVYDRKQKEVKELEAVQINEYKLNTENNHVELDEDDYLNIYSFLFDNDDFFDRTTKEKDKYLMSLTTKKLSKGKYKSFFKDRIKFFPLKILTENQVKAVRRPSNIVNRKLGLYDAKYEFLKNIKDKNKGYFQYNLASSKLNNSALCEMTLVDLLSIAKESIFIITTKIDSGFNTKVYKKFDELRSKNDKNNLYIRVIEGFNTDKDLLYIDLDNNYYSQIFNNMIHSKIIIVDNLFVALGSGNWFSSDRSIFEDSLVIFPCENAIKKYCPIYDSRGDYYMIFNQLINNTNDLKTLLDLYSILKKDLSYDNNSNVRNVFDEALIKKIQKLMVDCINIDFELIVNFIKHDDVNKQEFKDFIISSNKVDSNLRTKFKNIFRGD